MTKNIESAIKQIDENIKFIEACNVGGEFMKSELQERIVAIARTKIIY
ncbi:MAG: hypothetical protein ACJZ1Y_05220 [Candidatus Neomarinimicrobiota bacterium]